MKLRLRRRALGQRQQQLLRLWSYCAVFFTHNIGNVYVFVRIKDILNDLQAATPLNITCFYFERRLSENMMSEHQKSAGRGALWDTLNVTELSSCIDQVCYLGKLYSKDLLVFEVHEEAVH